MLLAPLCLGEPPSAVQAFSLGSYGVSPAPSEGVLVCDIHILHVSLGEAVNLGRDVLV